MSAIDPTSLPTLADVLDRGEDPTDYVATEHLADIVQNTGALSDGRRAGYANSERAMAHHFADNPPPDGDNDRRVLALMWSAELTDSPDLVARLIQGVVDPEARAHLSAYKVAGEEERWNEEMAEARRWEEMREPPTGTEWIHIDEFILNLYATSNGRDLGDAAENAITTVYKALEGFAPHLESVLRPLVPAGVDVLIHTDR